MIEICTYFGMFVAILLVISVLTYFIGWTGEDYNFVLRWIMSCILYAITTTILINLLIK